MSSATAPLPLVEPQQLLFESDGRTPNNRHPVLLYKAVLHEAGDKAALCERLFAAHHWSSLWQAGIFNYQHYHPNAHEALGVVRGSGKVLLGGVKGRSVELQAGDVLILPAGVGHCRTEASADFLVIGAYPRGQEDYEIERPSVFNHEGAEKRIARVELPLADPLFGEEGPLRTLWLPAEKKRSEHASV
ncbi:cupin domain-containing protein [Pseudomonas sp. LRF_L74]|uniref:cupin domain-containing protein n=1 Tax=Pseudomonas sp. LRF_L74 TaxID=3369422 RepID=UPI003F5DF1BF